MTTIPHSGSLELHGAGRIWARAAQALTLHLFLWWLRARTRSQLRALDARLLDDIGVSRRDALMEGWRPFWRP
jgi:uncharacterized protein YjiS (DUF1127 family)